MGLTQAVGPTSTLAVRRAVVFICLQSVPVGVLVSPDRCWSGVAMSPGFLGAHPPWVTQSSALAADFQLQQNNTLSPRRPTLPADLCADSCVPWK